MCDIWGDSDSDSESESEGNDEVKWSEVKWSEVKWDEENDAQNDAERWRERELVFSGYVFFLVLNFLIVYFCPVFEVLIHFWSFKWKLI